MNIDLGKKCDDLACPTPPASSKSESKVYYPSLYLEGVADLKDIPESGEITIRYRRAALTVADRDGKKRVSTELEVRAITGINGDSGSDDKSAADALDEIREALEGADDDEGDETEE